MSFHQFLLILRARAWVIILSLLVLVSCAVALSLLLPKKYTAIASVLIDAKGSDPVMGAMIPNQLSSGYMATQVDIISSERVAQRVVKELRLADAQSVQEDWRDDTDGQGSITVWLAQLLLRQLEVIPSKESNVLSIAYTGADPEFSALLANTWAKAYIDTSLELKVEPAKLYAKWFDGQTEELRRDLAEAQKRLSAFQQERGIVATDERLDVESARLAELSSQLSAIQAQLVDSESRRAQSANPDAMPEVMQNGLIQSLKGDLARQESLKQQLAARYGANHPEIARVDADIASIKEKIGAETRRVVRALGTTTRVDAQREAEIKASLEAQKKRVLNLKAERDQINVLSQDVVNAQRAYDLVTQRLAQTSLESQAQQTNIVVLTPADPPLEASSPRPVLNVALAIFGGSLIGLILAMMMEKFDARIRGVEDLEQLDSVPILGIIPGAAGRKGAA